jgi:phosphoglycerol transferase MdoB-like AlkP superfamily enzyme
MLNFASMKFTFRFAGLKHRIKLWLILSFLIVFISFVTRLALLIKSYRQIDFNFLEIARVFAIGLIYDCVNAVYFTLPVALYLWLLPERLYNKAVHRHIIFGFFFILILGLFFNGAAEWLFWDEFNSRFNFIAVDYLVYTNEVVGNINQSYPIVWILVGIVIVSAITTTILKPIFRSDEKDFKIKQRSKAALVYSLLFVLCYFGFSTRFHSFSKNSIVNELAGNGLYELFAAYLNNELDYDQFYRKMTDDRAFNLIHNMLRTNDSKFVDSALNSTSIERDIYNAGPEKRLNVVLISVESFSADFMRMFGNEKNITPHLDSLADQSLVFTNLYATGTRTVRGLEALSLCVPPTPGQSIVRRPANEHLFSLGKVFHDKGYKCKYIYGGYGYFDNMNYFFGSNEYDVIDRTALPDEDVHYENVWGVSDEDLFTLAERQIDLDAGAQPIFAHIMTTSNHRPFTYPDGRIDIPSHSGRDGAVKYTDFSISKFLKNVSKKSWFANTLFIIVADHCASSAGKTELPVDKYHIPMLIFSPGNVAPGKMTRLMSQIDIGPTVLGMLNFSYRSKFFGYDMYKLEAGRERAFISTYQKLGFMKNGKLVILSPRQEVLSVGLSENFERTESISDSEVVSEAIAWYQTASYSFKHGLMKGND